jgi:hypothetical protein
MYYNKCICESSGIDIYCTKQASDYLLARSSENDRSRLSCPAVQLAPDAIKRRTTNAGKVAVRCSSIVVLDGLASYKDAAQNISNQLLSFVIVKVHDASASTPAGVGLKWKLTPVASPQAHSAVETSWYFQFAEH